MENKLTYEETFKIRASEVDTDQEATLPAICNLLQEVAGNHARQLGFDITDLQENKLTWVLHRLKVKMKRFPEWRETITIQTWPSGGDGLRAHRDFLILDAEETVIGRALSYWLILDVESRRPNRIPKKILQSVPKESEHVMPVEGGSFSEIKESDRVKEFTVRQSDLDLNLHLNNVRYVEWALASLPGDEKPREVDIKFIAEAMLGDMVEAVSQNAAGGGYKFQLVNRKEQKVLALGHCK